MQCPDEQKDQAWPNTQSKLGLPEIQHHYPAQEMKNASDRLHKSDCGQGSSMRPARRSSSMAQPIGSMTGRGKKMDRATRLPRTQKGSNECSSQDRISWSPTFVAIRFQQLLASFALGLQSAEEVVQRAPAGTSTRRKIVRETLWE